MKFGIILLDKKNFSFLCQLKLSPHWCKTIVDNTVDNLENPIITGGIHGITVDNSVETVDNFCTTPFLYNLCKQNAILL